MRLKLPCTLKYASHKPAGSIGIVQRDIVRYRVKVAQCRLGPYYFSHRAMCDLARE